MKTLSLSLLVLSSLIFSPAIRAAEGEDLSVKIMTFNIRYSNLGDGRDAWPFRREFVVDVIHRFEGDFVGIQEARPDQVAWLREKLPQYGFLALSREKDPAEGEAVPLLYRQERWKLDAEEQGTFWLSETPEEAGSKSWATACARIVTWARLVEKQTGRGVYVYNTHFDHISEQARRKGAALLAARIAARTKPGEPVLVMGDLNCGESSAAVSYLMGKTVGSPVKLLETFRAVNPEAKDVGTFHAFSGDRKGDKIDYIFASPGAKIASAAILHDAREGRYPSDHFPVTAEVRFGLQ